MKLVNREGQVAHFGRKDFLLDRWGGTIWIIKTNEEPYSKNTFEAMEAWCQEQGVEFACKKYKFFYFGNEQDITMFKLRWV